jgi:hypothetical protein
MEASNIEWGRIQEARVRIARRGKILPAVQGSVSSLVLSRHLPLLRSSQEIGAWTSVHLVDR